MKTETAAPARARALIVDDDPGVRDFLELVLRKERLQVQVARDGREAEYWMRTSRFDVVFLDLRLPVLSGEVLIEMIRAGHVPAPTHLVVTSASTTQPIQGYEFLAKPFGTREIKALLERLLGSAAAQRELPDSRSILLVGSGLWCDSLGRVILRNGGNVISTPRAAEALPIALEKGARVVVLGPPIAGETTLSLAMDLLRETPATVLVAAAQEADALIYASLLQVGVAGVIVVPAGLPELGTEIFRRVGLVRRGHPRAPLKSMVLIELRNDATAEGAAIDVSEGGVGLRAVSSDLPHAQSLRLAFELPGEKVRVRAAAELAWSLATGDGKWNVGLRFTSVDGRDVERIRAYLRAAGALEPGE